MLSPTPSSPVNTRAEVDVESGPPGMLLRDTPRALGTATDGEVLPNGNVAGRL